MAAVSKVASVPAAPTPRVGDTLNQAWKNDKTKFGLKMLQKMGWTEGKGLGKREDGVSEHVKVAKKSNNLGLGASHDSTGAAGWASTAVSFNGVLEALGKAYGQPSAKGDSSSSKKRKKSKKRDKRRQKGDGAEDANSSSSSGEGAPASSAQAASSCPSRARRVRSKDVKGFSSADLRAILGQAATSSSLPSYPVIGGVGRSAEEATKKKKTPKKKRSREEMAVVSADPGAPTQVAPHRPRTRSLDLAEPQATAEPTAAAAKRPRTRSMDHAEGEGGGLGSADAGVAESSSSRPRKLKTKAKKAGRKRGDAESRATEGGAEEEAKPAAAKGEEKRREKDKKGRRRVKE